MPVGAWYVDMSELDEFTEALRATAGDIKDLTKVYREIGKKTGLYVKYHEPVYAGPTKGRHNTVHLQDRTKGGGGKGGAYASISKVDYLGMSVVESYAAPSGPDCMDVSPDGRLLYVASRWAGKLTVIDTVQKTVLRQIKVGKSPHGVWTLDHAPLQ